MLLLPIANFNVGLLMHLLLVLPNVVQSHICKGRGRVGAKNHGHLQLGVLRAGHGGVIGLGFGVKG